MKEGEKTNKFSTNQKKLFLNNQLTKQEQNNSIYSNNKLKVFIKTNKYYGNIRKQTFDKFQSTNNYIASEIRIEGLCTG